MADTGSVVEVKFEEWMKGGFELCKENAQLLVISTLVACVVSVATLGLLVGPMMAGMVLMVLRLVDKQEPKPVVGDIFKGFAYFLPAFLLILAYVLAYGCLMLVSMIPFVGFIARILMPVVSIAAGPFLTMAIFLVVDRNMGIVDAVKESIAAIMRVFRIYSFSSCWRGIISSLGIVACCVGILFTSPMAVCMQALAFRALYPAVPPAAPVAAPVA